MLHFSCDLCGRHLSDRRFVVRMEVYPSFDPEEFDETDFDDDHLQSLSEEIEEMEVTGQSLVEDCSSRDFRFDLCTDCRKKFVKDPLGRDALRRLNFSEN